MGFKSLCLAIVFATSAVIVAGQIGLDESKIIGGTAADVNRFPSRVALSDVDPPTGHRYFSCGGSLVSKWIVLTAAHCVDDAYQNGNGALSSNLRGRVGSNTWKTGGQEFSFSRNITHPMHDAATLEYDISLLYTSTAVVLSKFVQPIKLDFDFVGAGVNCVVTGWGSILKGRVSPDNLQLQQLQLTTVDGDTCVKEVAQAGIKYHYNLPDINPKLEICAVNSPNHGTCNGDSGGALIRLDRGTMVGLVTWGIPCATGAPDVFARLSAMKDWLLEHLSCLSTKRTTVHLRSKVKQHSARA